MSQEDKLKEAKRLYETANADQRYVLESLFPSLRESELVNETITIPNGCYATIEGNRIYIKKK